MLFVTFISTTTHKGLQPLRNGTTGPKPSSSGRPINGAGINATGGLEQAPEESADWKILIKMFQWTAPGQGARLR